MAIRVVLSNSVSGLALYDLNIEVFFRLTNGQSPLSFWVAKSGQSSSNQHKMLGRVLGAARPS